MSLDDQWLPYAYGCQKLDLLLLLLRRHPFLSRGPACARRGHDGGCAPQPQIIMPKIAENHLVSQISWGGAAVQRRSLRSSCEPAPARGLSRAEGLLHRNRGAGHWGLIGGAAVVDLCSPEVTVEGLFERSQCHIVLHIVFFVVAVKV